MQVEIKYFASLKEQAGVSQEMVDTNATNGLELFYELKEKHQLRFDSKHLRLAINQEYADFNTPLKTGDVVAFIPPVAGG